MSQFNIIVAFESTVMAEYTSEVRQSDSYQSEAALEWKFIYSLSAQK